MPPSLKMAIVFSLAFGASSKIEDLPASTFDFKNFETTQLDSATVGLGESITTTPLSTQTDKGWDVNNNFFTTDREGNLKFNPWGLVAPIRVERNITTEQSEKADVGTISIQPSFQ